MDLRRLEGDVAEADDFSWEELLRSKQHGRSKLRKSKRQLGTGLSALAFVALGLTLFLAPWQREPFPSLEALQSSDPSVDIQLLRLHERMLHKQDEASLHLRLRCALWLKRRAQH
ncbi:MAG: hypothetical protein CSA62_08860 [Planctomycetota bacterium]|nr:MAG: hypothetical protein CSA62_08860 [Planctomycetota bacterium]